MNNIFNWSIGFDKSKNGCHNVCDSRSWERKTGLDLATLTLPRLCSTNRATSVSDKGSSPFSFALQSRLNVLILQIALLARNDSIIKYTNY